MDAAHHKVETLYESQRLFQMWLYELGHKQLLLRSVKGDRWSTRIDVLFKGVDSLSIPTQMKHLRIESTSDTFRLSGDEWEGGVSALPCFVSEDEGEYYDPSPFSGSLRSPGD